MFQHELQISSKTKICQSKIGSFGKIAPSIYDKKNVCKTHPKILNLNPITDKSHLTEILPKDFRFLWYRRRCVSVVHFKLYKNKVSKKIKTCFVTVSSIVITNPSSLLFFSFFSLAAFFALQCFNFSLTISSFNFLESNSAF